MAKGSRPDDEASHHRLVKTTPKPRATKNSSGELGPLPEFTFGFAVEVGLGVADIVGADEAEAILDEI